MKKIKLACLTLIAPFALLCACTASTPDLSIESNWYLQTGEKHVISPTAETCTYNVKFTASEEAEKAGYHLEYENGVYTTTLVNEQVPLEDGTSVMGYKFTTSLSADITVHYGGDKSEPIHNTMNTEVLFLDADSGLKPVRSYQEVHETLPLGLPSAKYASLADSYRNYDYSITTTYNSALSEASFQLKDLSKTEDDEAEAQQIKLKGSGSYLDNEQIILALRGLALTDTPSFRSINPNSRQCVGVVFSEKPVAVRETCTFLLNGEETTETIDAYEFSLSYSSQKFTGQSKKFVYAQKTSPTNNVYRNALLRVEQPFIYSHGTFVFTIASADFTK